MATQLRSSYPAAEIAGETMNTIEDLVTVEEFADRCKIGRTMVFALIRAGDLRSIKIRRRRLIPIAEIPAFIARKLEEATRG